MKKIIIISVLILTVLSGCTGEIERRIAQADEQITALEEQVEQQNQTIASLYTVFLAYQKRDFITGITQLEGNVGYAVHFNSFGDIVIYHGTDAHVPRVGIQRNPADGNYYWTIQYGNGDVEFIVTDTGSMVSAVGLVPLLKIEDGKFYISYDSRETWQYIGQADGNNGDDIFEKIIVTDDYIVFKTDTDEFKIPTNALAQALYQNSLEINQNIASLTGLIKDLAKKAVWVTSIEDYSVDGNVVGTKVTFSNGSFFIVRDWQSSTTPAVMAVQEEGDSVYYWAIVYADGTRKWILDSEGKRIAATSEKPEIPVVTPVLDPADNTYYWNVVAAGDTTLVLDLDGLKVPVTSHEGELALIKSLNNSNPDYLYIEFADGHAVKIPKAYFLELSETELTMKASATKKLTYRFYGADASAQFNFVTQGDVSASVSPDSEDIGAGSITVETGASFSGNGKVVILAKPVNGTYTTVEKCINISKED